MAATLDGRLKQRFSENRLPSFVCRYRLSARGLVSANPGKGSGSMVFFNHGLPLNHSTTDRVSPEAKGSHL